MGEDRVEAVLDEVGLRDRAADRSATYSQGMQQRLGVAAALFKDPELGICLNHTHEKEDNMGKIVVTEYVSLDGVIETPGGGENYKHQGWTFEIERGEEGDKFKLDETLEAEAQLLGRVTYEGMAAAWPTMTDEAGFAEKFNSMPKYVFSSTLEKAEWNNSTILSGDFAEEIGKLKQQVDGVILVAGSAQLVQGLLEHDLVDEIRLMVFPVLLGSGKRLFAEHPDKKPLRLVDSKTVGAGVAVLTYVPA